LSLALQREEQGARQFSLQLIPDVRRPGSEEFPDTFEITRSIVVIPFAAVSKKTNPCSHLAFATHQECPRVAAHLLKYPLAKPSQHQRLSFPGTVRRRKNQSAAAR
jgi:hypothetical protein